jgi:hypothetical protein
MALALKTLLALLALASPPLARSETLDCEFTEGRSSTARVDAKTGKWLWASPKRGEAVWFAKAGYSTGATAGTLAGSHTRPANDDRPAQVAYGAGFVSVVSVGSNGTNTLAAATQGLPAELAKRLERLAAAERHRPVRRPRKTVT